eukprot:9879159-Alexandrium_andersonii.AAC.1
MRGRDLRLVSRTATRKPSGPAPNRIARPGRPQSCCDLYFHRELAARSSVARPLLIVYLHRIPRLPPQRFRIAWPW